MNALHIVLTSLTAAAALTILGCGGSDDPGAESAGANPSTVGGAASQVSVPSGQGDLAWSQVKAQFDANKAALKAREPGPEILVLAQAIFYHVESGSIGTARQLLADRSYYRLKSEYGEFIDRHIDISMANASVIEAREAEKEAKAKEAADQREALRLELREAEKGFREVKVTYEKAIRSVNKTLQISSDLSANPGVLWPDDNLRIYYGIRSVEPFLIVEQGQSSPQVTSLMNMLERVQKAQEDLASLAQVSREMDDDWQRTTSLLDEYHVDGDPSIYYPEKANLDMPSGESLEAINERLSTLISYARIFEKYTSELKSVHMGLKSLAEYSRKESETHVKVKFGQIAQAIYGIEGDIDDGNSTIAYQRRSWATKIDDLDKLQLDPVENYSGLQQSYASLQEKWKHIGKLPEELLSLGELPIQGDRERLAEEWSGALNRNLESLYPDNLAVRWELIAMKCINPEGDFDAFVAAVRSFRENP